MRGCEVLEVVVVDIVSVVNISSSSPIPAQRILTVLGPARY